MYLYPSKEDATRGTKFGGTGFLVSYSPKHYQIRHPHVYAVTNHHVAVGGSSPVIRATGKDGGNKIFEFDSSDWEFVPGGDDIAVAASLVRVLDGAEGPRFRSQGAFGRRLRWRPDFSR